MATIDINKRKEIVFMAIILTNNSEKIDKKFKKGLNYLKDLGYLKSKKVINEDTYKKSSVQIKNSHN